MIIGAIIAAFLWIGSLVYTVVTLEPWEKVDCVGSLFLLVVVEVVAIAIGATIQLIQGTL